MNEDRMAWGAALTFCAAYLAGRVADVSGGLTDASLGWGLGACVAVGTVGGLFTYAWARR